MCRLAEEIATIILAELRDPGKVTSGILESAKGRYCQSNITEEDRQAFMGMKAHNAIAESCHASATAGLKYGNTMRLDHAGAVGQSTMNGDFKQGNKDLVTGKRSLAERDTERNGDTIERPAVKEGLYQKLLPKLRDSLVQTARENVADARKRFDDSLKRQRAAR